MLPSSFYFCFHICKMNRWGSDVLNHVKSLGQSVAQNMNWHNLNVLGWGWGQDLYHIFKTMQAFLEKKEPQTCDTAVPSPPYRSPPECTRGHGQQCPQHKPGVPMSGRVDNKLWSLQMIGYHPIPKTQPGSRSAPKEMYNMMPFIKGSHGWDTTPWCSQTHVCVTKAQNWALPESAPRSEW